MTDADHLHAGAPTRRVHSDGFAGYRHLAVRVIDQALRDLSGTGTAEDRASALTFFSGSPMLYLWCAVAQLDPRTVIQRGTTPRPWPARGPVAR